VSRESWGPVDVVALLSVTLLGGLLRFVRLGDPRSLMFDEVYYARDACWYAYSSESVCRIAGEQTQVHPPLGKYLMALGIKMFGYDSFGWRAAAAVAGTLIIAVLYVLARKLLSSTLAATVVAGLLAIDLLAFVQSRIGMLDIFAALFGLSAVLCAAYDRDGILARRRRRSRAEGHSLARPWRLAAGVAAGAAVASKWSGVLALVTVAVLVVAWETRGRGLGRALREEGSSIVLYLAVVPLLVYTASYIGRLEGALLTAPWAEGAWLRAFWDRQTYMLSFHSGLEVTHAYGSPPWSWVLLKRPVSYFFETDGAGDYLEVVAVGSPLVWWASLGALAYTAARWLPRRDPEGPEGIILAGFAFGYLPWFVLSGDRSAVFLFYLLPVVPFMCLALGYVVSRLEPLPAARPAVALFCAAAAALFVFYFPLLTKRPLPREAWLDRIWVFDNCERPSGAAGRSAVGAGSAIESSETGEEPRPPTGWCWI
jgi:dolichyl-phosphate-mannose-protein mannosyltransferase